MSTMKSLTFPIWKSELRFSEGPAFGSLTQNLSSTMKLPTFLFRNTKIPFEPVQLACEHRLRFLPELVAVSRRASPGLLSLYLVGNTKICSGTDVEECSLGCYLSRPTALLGRCSNLSVGDLSKLQGIFSYVTMK